MTINRTEGLRGLFKGLLPTVLTNAPFSGVAWFAIMNGSLCL